MLTLMYLLNRAKEYVLAFPYKREVFICLALILFGAGLYRYCTAPEPAKPQIDFFDMQKVNSQNEQERREALEDVIGKVDAKRELRDDQIAEIERKIEERKEGGRNITAAELELLIERYR